MTKKGDQFTNINSGEVVTVSSVDSNTIILATKDNFHSFITNSRGIESDFMPFIGTEETIPKAK